jgi:hypothetical protein
MYKTFHKSLSHTSLNDFDDIMKLFVNTVFYRSKTITVAVPLTKGYTKAMRYAYNDISSR